MQLQDDQVPLPNDSFLGHDIRPLTPELPKANPALNPFITDDVDSAVNGVESPPVPSIAAPSSPFPSRPLPPIPPRQRSFIATDPIRIPIHIVRSNKSESTGKQSPSVEKSNARPIISSVVQPKPVAETVNNTAKQNGNGYFNGVHKPNELNNHEPTYSSRCPCKSGAHPKHAGNRTATVNGYGSRAVPARNLGKFVD